MSLDAQTTALLVLDLQNEIVEPGGKRYPDLMAQLTQRRILERAGQAVSVARQHAVEVIFVTVGWHAGYPDLGTAPQMAAIRGLGGFEDGSWGAAVAEAVAPAVGEIVVRKRCVSALKGTELPRYLTVKGIRTLVMIGVATNWAVEATVRDAADLGYRVVVLEDCCASFSDEMHEFSCSQILPVLGTVWKCREFEDALARDL
jgi:nicotinamidase-related amidase